MLAKVKNVKRGSLIATMPHFRCPFFPLVPSARESFYLVFLIVVCGIIISKPESVPFHNDNDSNIMHEFINRNILSVRQTCCYH